MNRQPAQLKTKFLYITLVPGSPGSSFCSPPSWAVASNLFAWPTGYFAMRVWLQNFAYWTSLKVMMFLGAARVALSIAAAVISLHAFWAARANP